MGNRKSLKRKISKLIAKCNPTLYFSISYILNHHRIPSFRKPKDLSEIWINRLLRGDFNKIYLLADKYKVRDYLKSIDKEYLLPSLLGVYDNPKEINFSLLPVKFALKLNTYAGRNLICVNKNDLNFDNVRKTLEGWLDGTTLSMSERHYNLIEKKIICEEFIDDGTGHFPTDYKFICVHGKAVCILACSERETGHARYSPFTTKWEPLPYYRKDGHFDNIPKPANLQDMIMEAESIASNFELVRIDLYSNGKKIWFGEITLTPAGCIFHNWSNKALDELGKKFQES